MQSQQNTQGYPQGTPEVKSTPRSEDMLEKLLYEVQAAEREAGRLEQKAYAITGTNNSTGQETANKQSEPNGLEERITALIHRLSQANSRVYNTINSLDLFI